MVADHLLCVRPRHLTSLPQLLSFLQTSSSSHYIIAASSQQSRSITNKSAVIHDFCIVIPYGAILIAGAAIHALTGSRALLRADLAVAAAGVLQILLSKMTLSKWRSGRSSAVVTMVEAVVAGGMGYAGWEGWRQGVGKIGSGCLAVVSVVVAVVLVYNVLAGGNPPKKSAE